MSASSSASGVPSTDMSDELDILARFPQGRVVCLGDIMLDRYVYGRVDRISPEAPIPVIAVEREAAMLGGVGNVARNVASLGGTAGLLATIGDDEAGREVLRLISEEERIEPDLITDIGRATTVKTRFVAGGQQLLRVSVRGHQLFGKQQRHRRPPATTHGGIS